VPPGALLAPVRRGRCLRRAGPQARARQGEAGAAQLGEVAGDVGAGGRRQVAGRARPQARARQGLGLRRGGRGRGRVPQLLQLMGKGLLVRHVLGVGLGRRCVLRGGSMIVAAGAANGEGEPIARVRSLRSCCWRASESCCRGAGLGWGGGGLMQGGRGAGGLGEFDLGFHSPLFTCGVCADGEPRERGGSAMRRVIIDPCLRSPASGRSRHRTSPHTLASHGRCGVHRAR
jgi:hypothetical protein